MIELFQNSIRLIWQPFLAISMPWQAGIMLFLFVLFFPLLAFRIFPMLLSEISKILFVFTWFSFERFLWLDHHLSAKKRRAKKQEPSSFSYFLGDLLQGILSNFNEIVEKTKSLRRYTSKLKIFLNEKRWLYILPFIVPISMWFVTPVFGATSQVTAITNNGAEFWCSLENWAMSSKMDAPYFGCHYPGKKPPLISNSRKTKEYELISKIQKYNKLIKVDPGNLDLYYERGHTYLEKGNTDLALKNYNNAIELEINYAPAYKGRGDVYFDKKYYKAAYKEYSNAISKDPNYAPGYKGRGDVYFAQKDYKAAYKEYSAATSKDPNYAPGYKGRGDVYIATKDYKAAFKEYRDATQKNPNYAPAYLQQGKIYANKFNNKSLAVKSYEIAADIFRKHGQKDQYKLIVNLINEIKIKK